MRNFLESVEVYNGQSMLNERSKTNYVVEPFNDGIRIKKGTFCPALAMDKSGNLYLHKEDDVYSKFYKIICDISRCRIDLDDYPTTLNTDDILSIITTPITDNVLDIIEHSGVYMSIRDGVTEDSSIELLNQILLANGHYVSRIIKLDNLTQYGVLIGNATEDDNCVNMRPATRIFDHLYIRRMLDIPYDDIANHVRKKLVMNKVEIYQMLFVLNYHIIKNNGPIKLNVLSSIEILIKDLYKYVERDVLLDFKKMYPDYITICLNKEIYEVDKELIV